MIDPRSRLDPANPWHQQVRRWLDVDTGGLSYDGVRYLPSHERRVPKPYHYRWLVPALARGDRRRYARITTASLAAMPLAMRWLTGRWTPGLYMFGLTGVYKLNRQLPVLVDTPAMLAAITSAAAFRNGHPVLGVGLSLVAGATKESAPLFAALYAWDPRALIGLAAPLLRGLQKPGADPVAELAGDHTFALKALTHRLETAWQAHGKHATNGRQWVTSWGALLAGLIHPTPQLAATLAASYGQCVVSTDTSRLYQWAWPVMAERTVANLPAGWGLLALVGHLFNPLRNDGIDT